MFTYVVEENILVYNGEVIVIADMNEVTHYMTCV